MRVAGWNGTLELRLSDEGQKQGNATIARVIRETIYRWKQGGTPAYVSLPDFLVINELNIFTRRGDEDNQTLMRAVIKAFSDKGWVSLTPNQQRLLPQSERGYEDLEDNDPYA